MIPVIARRNAKSDKTDKLMNLARDLVKTGRSEAKNITYDFYADFADPVKATFIEVWNDQTPIDFHNTTVHCGESRTSICRST